MPFESFSADSEPGLDPHTGRQEPVWANQLTHHTATVLSTEDEHEFTGPSAEAEREQRDHEEPVGLFVADRPAAEDDQADRIVRIEQAADDLASTEEVAVVRIVEHVDAGEGDDERKDHHHDPADLHSGPPLTTRELVEVLEHLALHTRPTRWGQNLSLSRR